MAHDVPQLLQMPNAGLDALFSSSPAGEIPYGPVNGTAIIALDARFSPAIAESIFYSS